MLMHEISPFTFTQQALWNQALRVSNRVKTEPGDEAQWERAVSTRSNGSYPCSVLTSWVTSDKSCRLSHSVFSPEATETDYLLAISYVKMTNWLNIDIFCLRSHISYLQLLRHL